MQALVKSPQKEEADLLEWPLKMIVLNPAKPTTYLVHLETVKRDILLCGLIWLSKCHVLLFSCRQDLVLAT